MTKKNGDAPPPYDAKLEELRRRDPDAALAIEWLNALEEDRDRMILGLHWPRRLPRGEKRGRGRPSVVDADPASIIETIESKPYKQLSTAQQQLADRLGRELKERGRTIEQVASIVCAVHDAKAANHPLTESPRHGQKSAYEVAGDKFGLSVEAVAAIWKRWRKKR